MSEPLMQRGHAAGDVLEVWEWRTVERSPGRLVVEAHLPDALKNPAGQLFGGFTTTYVDLVSIFTIDTLSTPDDDYKWHTTINMRCDYLEPIVEPWFTIVGEVVNQRGRNALVSTSFLQGDTMASYAITTLRQVDLPG